MSNVSKIATSTSPHWRVVSVEAPMANGEEWLLQNVVPRYGQEHILNPGCWCQPELCEIWGAPTGERGGVLVHNQAH